MTLEGCLNYVIYSIIKQYVKLKGERYFRYEKFIGTLNSCAMEIYRRLIAPYEDGAIDKNGDV